MRIVRPNRLRRVDLCRVLRIRDPNVINQDFINMVILPENSQHEPRHARRIVPSEVATDHSVPVKTKRRRESHKKPREFSFRSHARIRPATISEGNRQWQRQVVPTSCAFSTSERCRRADWKSRAAAMNSPDAALPQHKPPGGVGDLQTQIAADEFAPSEVRRRSSQRRFGDGGQRAQ